MKHFFFDETIMSSLFLCRSNNIIQFFVCLIGRSENAILFFSISNSQKAFSMKSNWGTNCKNVFFCFCFIAFVQVRCWILGKIGIWKFNPWNTFYAVVVTSCACVIYNIHTIAHADYYFDWNPLPEAEFADLSV